ncbi:MAG: DUF4136 domain-containing protein [Algoriphagus sp.]|uniref:DUF4136 domain-containing protein n=1 Tax=Algoriphagus sp. TaxID=1872435 RepID=UPI002730827F|nr:DUF4136 domain-containing protein [Algoriphagus sp.]MDP2040107.1 DUF4136 domain-containing protein [Algoriphagus sp.]MDP3470566.1 DUF4136 domain-containing protein [Algoriphagus sp.]
MKISSALLLILVVITASCFSSKDYVTDYDYNYTGSFKKYRTFAFVESGENESSPLSSVLNATIGARLGSQGYREQINKPDMLVSYKIFSDSIRYRGYVQPEFDYWLNRTGMTYRNEEGEIEREQEKDETYNQVKYAQNNGMLVIYVIDSKKGSTIWQGYTAAKFDQESPSFQSDITRAAYRVMNEFKIINRLSE